MNIHSTGRLQHRHGCRLVGHQPHPAVRIYQVKAAKGPEGRTPDCDLGGRPAGVFRQPAGNGGRAIGHGLRRGTLEVAAPGPFGWIATAPELLPTQAAALGSKEILGARSLPLVAPATGGSRSPILSISAQRQGHRNAHPFPSNGLSSAERRNPSNSNSIAVGLPSLEAESEPTDDPKIQMRHGARRQ